MATVTISVRGRPYTIACEDGEEPRVQELAASLDAEVGALGKVLGGLGESHLLVITGLSLIDRINDLRVEADSSATQMASASGNADARIAEIEQKAADDLAASEAEIQALTKALEAERQKTAALESDITAAAARIESIAALVEET